jgi:hypothetical protein
MKSDLDIFIKQILQELNNGIQGTEWKLHDEIEFEVFVQVSQKSKGGFDLKVVGASGESLGNTSQRVKFKIINETEKNKNNLEQIKGAGMMMKSLFQPLLEANENNKKRLKLLNEIRIPHTITYQANRCPDIG